MTDALREVKIEYTLLLLDDFFHAAAVDIARLADIVPLDGCGSGHRLFQQRRDRRGV